ncbi:MAG TPA: PQQ-binding-like beta-propeller repeat protein [Caldisericia bacterium]|nr:PQQ-binding-like beta-propeller repeat protein [Caldisericia bacterium]HPF48918.1 PQQ-binding-like beta-propeller repeat protein [Caldisericia bacterium]HPI83218.1 PQQ-binding-like beta-propeller repeat protein [Caldisericia bacterium]HPQ92445.1 PQQ-binding-like beta-propeller repeat protein [Caldisericia bacterium]HRV74457.1 PQQ-binding-like beta-propeller repeat protein [Caldisericia bacterium]
MSALILVLALAFWQGVVDAEYITRYYQSDFEIIDLVEDDHIQNTPLIHGGYVSWYDTRLNDREGRIMPRLYMKKLSTGEDKYAMTFAKKSGAKTQYRNKVVWAENTDRLRPDNFDIKMYDFTTGKSDVVVSNKRKQDNPQISTEYIIWRDWRDTPRGDNGMWDFAIYGKNIQGNEEFLIKPVEMKGTAELFNRYVILSVLDEAKRDYDIQLYIAGSDRMIPICTANGDQFNPKVVGDVVIWQDCRKSPANSKSKQSDIFGYSLSTKRELYISTDPKRETGLTVGGDKYAVWFRDTDGFAGSFLSTIHGYNAVSGEAFSVCLEPGIYRNPVIGGDWVVWEVHNNNEFGVDLKAYNFETKKTHWVVRGYGDQRNPKIYGNELVWEDHACGSDENVNIKYARLVDPIEGRTPKRWGFFDLPIWSMNRHDSNQQAVVNVEIRNMNMFPMNAQWSTELDGVIRSSASCDGSGFGYVGTDNGSLYKFSIFTGEVIWQHKVTGRIRSTPAVYGGRVFFGDGAGRFYCLNTDDGALIWQVQTESAIDSSPVVFLHDVDHYPVVVFSSGNKKLYMYNAIASTPDLKWSIDLDGWLYDSISVDYNYHMRHSQDEPVRKMIYLGISSNKVMCIDPVTGDMLSSFETKSPVKGSTIAFGSDVLAACSNGEIYSVDFSSWGRAPYMNMFKETVHNYNNSLVFDIGDYSLVYESDDGELSMYDGSENWRIQLDTGISSSPCATSCNKGEEAVFAVTTNGIVYMLNRKTGEKMWMTETNTNVYASPTVFDTGFLSVFVGTSDGWLRCWGQRPSYND